MKNSSINLFLVGSIRTFFFIAIYYPSFLGEFFFLTLSKHQSNYEKIHFHITPYWFSALTYSQWKKSGKNDVFNGNYRSAMVIGSGGNFPYTKPILVVNYFEKSDNLNIYIDNAGYSGCSNKVIYFKFDGEIRFESFSFSSAASNYLSY